MEEQRFKKGDRVMVSISRGAASGTVESYEPDHSGTMYYRVKTADALRAAVAAVVEPA